MTPWPRSSSTCSSRISGSSPTRSTKAFVRRARRPLAGRRDNKSRRRPPRPRQLRPGADRALSRTRSMTELHPRIFRSDAEIEHIGEGLVERTLPRPEWTHEAHLAATIYILLRRPGIDIDEDLPGLIRRYNESVGGVNSDTEGYHETITRAFLRGVRLFLAEADREAPLHELVNALLLTPMGRRDWPLRFYSRDRLFSVAARRGFIAPDIAALP